MRVLLSVGFVLLSAAPAAAGAPPQWARDVAGGAHGPADAAAVVLHDEVDVIVADDGKVRTVRRYAARVQTRDGRMAAAVREVYLVDGGKVREVRGWILRLDGSSRELGNAHIVDAAVVDNDVYNEVRVRVLVASDDIADGEVFCAEVESEGRLLFRQFEWQLQERWPVRVARRSLKLPAGWRATSVTFNGPPVDATSINGGLVWEVRDLPEIRQEHAMPPVSALSRRLAVSLFASGDARRSSQFETWADVAVWLLALNHAGQRPADAVARKAQELTAGAASDVDRIRAIASYVQSVQYVSIQTGLGRGGGYQPRPPELVLSRNYGDCKDKASLMRAMLAAVGIQAHPVAIFSGDRDYVREQWPSPQQFNHMIVAISASGAPDGWSVLQHPVFGRLLMFDPTDEYTPLGELPLHEQGSLALLVAPGGGLERMPVAPAAHHRVLRKMELRMDEHGAMTVHVTERLRGHRAAAGRALRRSLDAARYREMLERRVTAAVPGARIVRFDADEAPDGEFMTAMEITATGYAQRAGNLWLVRPLFLPGQEAAVPAGHRRHAVLLEPSHIDETFRVHVPSGIALDELPAPVTLDTPFGRYALAYTAEEGAIVATRRVDIPGKIIPPADHAAFRAFVEKFRAADLSPVVLVKR